MRDPFFIEGDARVSFSGGRTSAYMLYRILQAHGGKLPSSVHVLFANTGKERVETLDFVNECATRWNVKVRWLEYTNFVPFVEVDGFELSIDKPGFESDCPIEWKPIFVPGDRSHDYKEVSYQTASRAGEPFEAAIKARRFLPNPVMRFCTGELKIKTMDRFLRHEIGLENWTAYIGLRADEPRRVKKTLDNRSSHHENECPLAAAGITVDDVMRFWRDQPFDLRLKTHEGNCDLCFLKGRDKLQRIMRARPDLGEWWASQENRIGRDGDATFRKDRPTYRRMLKIVQDTPLLPGLGLEEGDDEREIDEIDLPCACTD